MAKTLSEQICEVCELERIQVKHNPHTKKTTYTHFKLDFEQPENFVKLMELITNIEGFYFSSGNSYIALIPAYQKYSILEDNEHNSYLSNQTGVKGFLECLIKHLKDDKDTREYIRDYDDWIWGQYE